MSSLQGKFFANLLFPAEKTVRHPIDLNIAAVLREKMRTSRRRFLKNLSLKSLFYHVGKWYVPTNKFENPEAACNRIASWLRNYSVETMIDQPNRVIFTVTNVVRERSSPFTCINNGALTFRKVADEPYLEIEYRINMAKTALMLIFAPLNQETALHRFNSIIFEGLTKDPLIMPSAPTKIKITKNEWLFLYVVMAPFIAGLIEMLLLWQKLRALPAFAEIFTGENSLGYAFEWAILAPVALLSAWMILVWGYVQNQKDTFGKSSQKNKQDFMIVIVTILLLWITIIGAISQVYANVGWFSFSSIDLPSFSLEFWMVGICLFWAAGFAFLFMKYFKG